jgi:TonB family protein
MISLIGAPRFQQGCVAIIAFFALLQPVYAAPSGQKKARAVYAPRPQLPEIARARRLRGNGSFQFHIRPDGSVWRVDVLRSTGHKILDDATVAALSKWRFEPGTQSEVRIPFTYTGNYDSR